MPKNIIACRPQSYCDFQSEAFPNMVEAGITNAEVPAPAEMDWAKLADLLKKYGITPTSVSGGIKFSDNMALTIFSHTARCAQELGAKIVFLSVKTDGKPFEDCYKKLRDIGEIAKANGVTVALETHPDMVTNGDEAVKTMKAVNHPNVKLNYDSANLYYYNEKIDGIAELKKMLPYLAAVHLKASRGKLTDWWFPGLHEEGDIVNYPEIFKLCNGAGFYGPFTMEIEGIKGEKLTREVAIARVANSMKYLRSIGVV
ncbi:MAG TPA: sugar phosphate isomerase/epimerase family protein [Planctomycetota bacterium]|nr:sugar phosphate isomerase/epimerase family protein [Planctomycetota bacterium]